MGRNITAPSQGFDFESRKMWQEETVPTSFFFDLLNIRHILLFQQNILMAHLFGLWMGGLPGVIYNTHKVHTKHEVNLDGWTASHDSVGGEIRMLWWRKRTLIGLQCRTIENG